ncbi:MAG: amino acid ABC transporter substrate-binding protein [Oscillibacter ruminantium]|uniref:amino acid ABC transporter substrate-binding protein n=1 Tax=Oscillibacter ruminantium TaxID=1263547 RepID=UPI002B20A3AA|nr:amino acid ABC transporter substrate-binding protein [Oscillibacter ruminantium]MEA5042314.1 amino acid ABC transporter substrate-binding protein [Oscillibacter ruminantium]
MNRRKILALLSAAAVVGSLAACGTSAPASSAASGSTSSTAAASASGSAERTTFTVGFDAEYPPYGYKADDGSYVGFDLDLAQEVCDRNGWELVRQPIDWNSKDMELDAGNIDCIWNGFTMTGREDSYTWVGPYVNNSIMFVVNADSGITDASELAGRPVVTQSGSSALTALTDDPGDGSNDENLTLAASFSALDEVPDYNTAFMNLESGVDDAIAVDIGVANYQLKTRGSDKFVMLEKPLSTEQYGIGFKKGNTELADQVKATLDEMLADGTFTKIATAAAENYDAPELAGMICYGE